MTAPPDFPPDGADHDGGLRTSHPPQGFVPVRRWVLDSIAELHLLRAGLQREVDARLGGHVDLGDVARDLVLVASELATNGMRHGRAPTIVELQQDETRFLLTVADHDLTSEPRVAGARPPGQGGFGLQIARRLSVDVGWYRTRTVKVVWAEIATRASPDTLTD
ncbi:ATP-binding protein [Cellulomonas cellasea]|uniref:Histidine kinase/HSP90-like ATPase domain-containing protein n=1 Tax=Cellulomonas cellasea TaxID=43670 RepID=A0A7W4UKQ6_9CELL|nr:ATP-binding protein [Cellulomonas cellasea]MBB2925505.1 hypothetical protein [Cellulomonas cellasea]